MIRRHLLALALLIPAAGCAGFRSVPAMPASSVAEDLGRGDAPAIASTVAGFVNLRQPPGPIVLQAPEGDPSGITERIAEDLRAAGHAVSATGRNRLAYQVEKGPGGAYLVGIALDADRAVRVLDRGPGGALAPASPYTMAMGGR